MVSMSVSMAALAVMMVPLLLRTVPRVVVVVRTGVSMAVMVVAVLLLPPVSVAVVKTAAMAVMVGLLAVLLALILPSLLLPLRLPLLLLVKLELTLLESADAALHEAAALLRQLSGHAALSVVKPLHGTDSLVRDDPEYPESQLP